VRHSCRDSGKLPCSHGTGTPRRLHVYTNTSTGPLCLLQPSIQANKEYYLQYINSTANNTVRLIITENSEMLNNCIPIECTKNNVH